MRWGYCKSCSSLGKEWSMVGYEFQQHLWIFSCTNPNHVYSVWRKWNGKTFVRCRITNANAKRSSWIGSGGNIQFTPDGKTVRTVTPNRLREFRSRVRTHEGETLSGKQARKYMDNHSKKQLGKDLSRTYNQMEVEG